MNAEDHLAALWIQLFGVSNEDEPVLVRAGGSSLDLVEIQLRMLKATGLSISLETLPLPATFSGLLHSLRESEETKTVSTNAQDGSSSRESVSTRPTKNRVTQTGPASPPQYAQWILERANPGDPGNMIPFLVMLPEHVTWRDLHSAVLDLVETHPALRTSVSSRTTRRRNYSRSCRRHRGRFLSRVVRFRTSPRLLFGRSSMDSWRARHP